MIESRINHMSKHHYFPSHENDYLLTDAKIKVGLHWSHFIFVTS